MAAALTRQLTPLYSCPSSPSAAVNQSNGEILLADFNNDGHLDLLLARTMEPGINPSYKPFPPTSLWINDGRGAFREEQNTGFVPTTYDVDTTLAVGDIDGDGDADVIIDNQVWRNNGAGADGLWSGDAFTSDPSTVTGLPEGVAYTLAFGDAEGDGDLDLVVGVGDGANTGNPNYTPLYNYFFTNGACRSDFASDAF